VNACEAEAGSPDDPPALDDGPAAPGGPWFDDHVDDGDPAAGLAPPGLRPAAGCTLPATAAAQAALLQRVMDQDEAALAALYQQLSGPVYALVLRITRQVPMAEELLEDVFWQVWRQAPRFDPARGTVRAWVLVMARSRALDALRSQRHNPLVAMDAVPDDGVGDGSAAASDPQDLLLAAQTQGALQAALHRLDPLLRQLVSLCYFRGLTQQEVADHTGLPLGTVKTHLRRSLALLRSALVAATELPPASEGR